MVKDKFIPTTQFIDKLPELCTTLELISVYDTECHSMPQLVYLLAQKLNQTITNMQHNDEALNIQLDDLNIKLEYLLGEGLTTELTKLIEKMYADGRLQVLVEAAMVDIKKKLDVIDTRLIGIDNSIASNLALINKNKTDIASNLTLINANKTDIASNLTKINKNANDISKMKGTIIYMADFPADTPDYSLVLNPLTSKFQDITIVCEANKEYTFKTGLRIGGRAHIQGNDSLWRYQGNLGSTFITFIESPWMIEGSTIENLLLWCRNKSDGPYQNINGIVIEGNHINIKFRNIKYYNFGYPVKAKDTAYSGTSVKTFGHSFISCSFWGFVTAMTFSGNCEQVLVQHCWLDDGQRTSGSKNPCILVSDATSFWIRDNVIQNCDIGISFRGVRNGEIQGNHFENMLDASIYLQGYVYETRNTNIIGNWLVGHSAGIRIISGTNKTVHTTIIGNCFGSLGTGAPGVYSTADNESNTLLINNSKQIGFADRPMTQGITTIKEFQ